MKQNVSFGLKPVLLCEAANRGLTERISAGHTEASTHFLLTQFKVNLAGASPVIVRKLGPPLLAGEPAPGGEHLPPVVLSFTHDALPNVDLTRAQPVRLQPQGRRHPRRPSRVSLTLLLVKVAVDVSLHLGVAAVPHPGQVFAGDDGTCLVVESSDVQRYFHVNANQDTADTTY